MLYLLTLLLSAPGAISCKSAELDKAVMALRTLSPQHAHTLALVGVDAACPLPGPVHDAVERLQAAPPEQRPLLQVKAIKGAPELWDAACPAGVKLFATLATAAPDSRMKTFWTECKLDRFGLDAQAFAARGDASPLGLMLAHVVHTHDPKVDKALLTALLAAPKEPAR